MEHWLEYALFNNGCPPGIEEKDTSMILVSGVIIEEEVLQSLDALEPVEALELGSMVSRRDLFADAISYISMFEGGIAFNKEYMHKCSGNKDLYFKYKPTTLDKA